MAFDFGAALSSAGQLYPAAVEGQELRRQRQAEAAAVQQRAQAASDEHLARIDERAARQAQTAREQQLAQISSRNASQYTPISSKPERGEDGKYYMLFMSPDNQIKRLPVDGNYDPYAEKKALLKELNVPEDSDLAKTVLLGVKPESYKTQVDLNPESPTYGKLVYVPTKPGGTSQPVMGPSGAPVGGRTPATTTTSTSDYHWVDNQGQVHATPTTRVTQRRYGGAPASTAPPAQTVPPASPRSSGSAIPPNGSKGDRIIGTGKLPAAAEKVVITTQPVIDQTDTLINRIKELHLENNNQPGYLMPAVIKYKLGIASDEGTLGANIADLSLGSVVDAASALAGSSRALPALKLAMQHTPNAALDSPKQLLHKLTTIRARLQSMVDESRSAGTSGQKAASQGPAAWEATFTDPKTGQKIGQRGGKYFDLATGQEVTQ